ncbi:hypothetical protein pb186bvf_005374 [Paramecium bursaria]
MEYRRLGNTGLKVSAIAYGNWLNSNDPAAIEANIKIVQRAWELGINYFDTAESYGFGEAEQQLGVALKTLGVQRQDLVISTKIYFGGQKDVFPNSKFLSRKHIIEGLRNSLKRLQTPYVDIVFAHRYDPHTPIEEVVRAFDWVVRKGLAHYWGTSEWSAQQILEAIGVADRLGLTPPVVEQPQYNLFHRDRFEWEYEPVFSSGYGSTVWSPLFQGLLSGKYNEDLGAEGRLTTLKENVFVKGFIERNLSNPEEDINRIQTRLQQFGNIAKELKISQAQLAIAWVLKNKDVSTAITGVTRIEQIEDTVKAIPAIKLITSDIERQIEEIFKNKPQTTLNWKMMAPNKTRRDLYI